MIGSRGATPGSGSRGGGRSAPAYGAGVAASLLGEVVFMAMVAGTAALRGNDPWTVVRVPASFLFGPEAVQPPGFVTGEVAVGLLMHLLLGIIVGLAYAALLPRLRVSPVAGGLIAGGVLYALGFWLLPQLFPDWLSPFWLPPEGRALQAGAHVVYGLVFGLAYRRWALR